MSHTRLSGLDSREWYPIIGVGLFLASIQILFVELTDVGVFIWNHPTIAIMTVVVGASLFGLLLAMVLTCVVWPTVGLRWDGYANPTATEVHVYRHNAGVYAIAAILACTGALYVCYDIGVFTPL